MTFINDCIFGTGCLDSNCRMYYFAYKWRLFFEVKGLCIMRLQLSLVAKRINYPRNNLHWRKYWSYSCTLNVGSAENNCHLPIKKIYVLLLLSKLRNNHLHIYVLLHPPFLSLSTIMALALDFCSCCSHTNQSCIEHFPNGVTYFILIPCLWTVIERVRDVLIWGIN